MMLSILLIFMVNRIIKNDAIFSSENLLKFLIVIASIFIIYKLPFYLVLKKILKEKEKEGSYRKGKQETNKELKFYKDLISK